MPERWKIVTVHAEVRIAGTLLGPARTPTHMIIEFLRGRCQIVAREQGGYLLPGGQLIIDRDPIDRETKRPYYPDSPGDARGIYTARAGIPDREGGLPEPCHIHGAAMNFSDPITAEGEAVRRMSFDLGLGEAHARKIDAEISGGQNDGEKKLKKGGN